MSMSDSSDSLEQTGESIADQTKLKLLYIAIYVGLQIIPTDQLPALNRHYAMETRPKLVDLIANQRSFAKAFPTSLNELVNSFLQGLGKQTDLTLARIKWRWATRNNGDVFLIRYIWNYSDLNKAARRVGEGLALQMTRFNAQQELERGEMYYLTLNPSYKDHLKDNYVHFVGHDNVGAPLVILEPYQSKANPVSREVSDRDTAVLLEHMYMLLPDPTVGSTVLLDIHKLKASRWDTNLAFSFLHAYYRCYPLTASRVIIHRPTKVFSLFWKLFRSFFEASRTKIIVFTYTPQDLLKYIPADQLPQYLGGKSSYDPFSWTDAKETDEIHNDTEKNQLIEERNNLLLEYERLTTQWFRTDKICAERVEILTAIELNYWKLDPYVRRRTIWDRHGTMGLIRPQFRAGELSQPVCEVNRPQLKPSVSL